jgi:hypothetical protein
MRTTQGRIASSLREQLLQLRSRIASGDESSLFVWVLPEKLACSQRPLRDHPVFGGRGKSYTREAEPALLAWVQYVKAAGIRSIITLMHPKELKYYEPIGAHPEGLLGLYRAAGFEIAHIPWADPAHETTPEARAAVMRHLEQVKRESLAAFQRLPTPALLHCSAAIDRSPPVLAYIVANTAGGIDTA